MPAAKPVFLLVPLVVLFPCPISPLSESILGSPVSGAASTALELHHVESEGEEWKVPVAARSLLTTFKKQLRELIGGELNGGAGSGSAEAIRARLVNALAREGVPVVEPDWQAASPYGNVVGLEVKRPAGLDPWLAVSVTQQIPCGEDASLYLFERREGRWRLAFALESNGYEDVGGALGSFKFGISQPDTHGGFFIVAGDINPWCSSNWQQIHYRAFRPGGDPLHPQRFFAENETIFISEGFELSVEADRFRVEFSGHQDLDAGILIRSYIRAYQVAGTKARRIGPLAAEERGFIDEWISLPWEIAARWTVQSKRESLRPWHDRLQKRVEDVYTEFDESRSCGTSRSQVILGLDPDERLNPLPRELFFTVLRRGDDFRMERIDVAEQAGCTGSP